MKNYLYPLTVCFVVLIALALPASADNDAEREAEPKQVQRIANARTYLADIQKEMKVKWPDNQTINIVTHGHSVPAGYFKTPHVNTFNAYPHLMHLALKQQYPNAVINIINTSRGGENSVKGESRFAEDVLRHRPDLITIDYALNDRAVGLEKSYKAWESMITMAKSEGIPVLLLTPTWDTRAKMNDADEPLNQHAKQIRELAKKHGVGLVDSHNAFRRYVDARRSNRLKDIMSTVNHPNRKGHELVAIELMRWFPE